MNKEPVCVQHREGWCILKDQRRTAYKDDMRTKCGNVVIYPLGIERRESNCEECLKAYATRKP